MRVIVAPLLALLLPLVCCYGIFVLVMVGGKDVTETQGQAVSPDGAYVASVVIYMAGPAAGGVYRKYVALGAPGLPGKPSTVVFGFEDSEYPELSLQWQNARKMLITCGLPTATSTEDAASFLRTVRKMGTRLVTWRDVQIGYAGLCATN